MNSWKQILSVVIITLIVSQIFNVVFSNDKQSLNGIAPAAQKTTFERMVDTGTIRCAYILYPPFLEINPNTGEKSGVSVDLINAVADKLNVKVEWTEEVAWGNLTEGLKSDRYDAVCTAVWQNAARAMHADFSTPYGYSTVDVWARADDARFDSDLSTINNKDIKISAIDGDAAVAVAQTNFPEAQLVSLPQTASFSNALLNVVNGKADVILVEPKIANDFLKNNPGSLKKVTLERPITAYPITFVLPKGQTEFKTAIDSALQEIFFTSEMETILSKNNIEAESFVLPKQPF